MTISNCSTPEVRSLSRKERASCRQLIINLVVSTDMAHHNALHDNLRALPPPPTEATTEAADALATRRTCLLKCALHAADLHVPTLPWASSVGWVRALGNEFKSMVEQARRVEYMLLCTTATGDPTCYDYRGPQSPHATTNRRPHSSCRARPSSSPRTSRSRCGHAYS